MNFNLHFGELNSDNSTNDKNSLFKNYIPKCHKVKRILIYFNCYSEYTSVTRGNSLELNKPRSRLNIRYNNFSQRVVNAWNRLPERVISSTTVNKFKKY